MQVSFCYERGAKYYDALCRAALRSSSDILYRPSPPLRYTIERYPMHISPRGISRDTKVGRGI